jgi:purine-binding chemotaxis protein CheW
MDKTAVLGALSDEQVVVLEVAGASYAVNISAIAEIIPRPTIVTVPRAPMFVEGIIDLRGRVIPVVDLRGRLGLTVEGAANRVVVAEVRGQTIGMIVDGVTEVLRLPSGSVEPPPKAATGPDSAFLRGVARLEGRLILLLDLDLVLNGGEIDELAGVPASASA